MRATCTTLALALLNGCIFGDNPAFLETDAGSTLEPTSTSASTTGEPSASTLPSGETSASTSEGTTAQTGPATTSGSDTGVDPACPDADLDADPDNCGGCGLRCYDSPCEGGSCAVYVVADGQDDPFGIAVDDTHVYWSNRGAQQLMRAPKSGGEPEVLAVADDTFDFIPQFVDLTPDFVLASVPNPGSAQVQVGVPMVAVPKQGGLPGPLGYPISDGIESIHAAGPFVYIAHRTTSMVKRAYLTGEWTDEITSDAPSVRDVTTAGDTIYFCGDGGVGMVAAEGGVGTPLATAQVERGMSIVTDGELVFVTTVSGMVSIDPTTEAVVEYANAQIGTMGIGVDDQRVYWVAAGAGANSGVLYSADKGDPASTVARASGMPGSHLLAHDDTDVFWTNRGTRPETGVVLRMAK